MWTIALATSCRSPIYTSTRNDQELCQKNSSQPYLGERRPRWFTRSELTMYDNRDPLEFHPDHSRRFSKARDLLIKCGSLSDIYRKPFKYYVAEVFLAARSRTHYVMFVLTVDPLLRAVRRIIGSTSGNKKNL